VSTVPPLITKPPVLIRQRRPRRRSRRTVLVVISPIPPPTTSPPTASPEPPGPPRDTSSDAWLALAVFVLLLQPLVLVGLAIALGLYVLLRIESVVGDELDRH
jgi:hypothetical protein